MPLSNEPAAPVPDLPSAPDTSRRTTQPTLQTARLTLVPLADKHLELEIELDSDAEVMRYLTGRALSRAEVERAHQRRIAAARQVPGLGFWAGFGHDDFIGWWVLQPPHGPDQPKVAGEADLGYRLLRRHWRRGHAAEGARELIRYGFDDVGLNRIFAQTMAVNTPSRATMTAAGLTFTRAFVSGDSYDDLVPGAEQGEVEYEITRSTWQQQRHRGTGSPWPPAACRHPPERRRSYPSAHRRQPPNDRAGLHRGGAWKAGLSIYGWSQGRETTVTDHHPGLKTSTGTIRLTPANTAQLTDDELRSLVRAALAD